ncbi:MAG: extracellular solute-binding protein [Planctomycetota bacterium]
MRPLGIALSLSATITLVACDDGVSGGNGDASPTVVLYTSADDVFAEHIVEAFETETGIDVQLVGDTEATKTTGLVTRLLAEQEAPRCDVWWSSEPMGTLLLEAAGVLAEGGMAGLVDDAWPNELVGAGQTWLGFAERGRVIAYADDRVETPPTTLDALTQPEWSGRVGMARPQFGTTRGHMALLHARWGGDLFEAWLVAMESNGLRIYDGNARVVRAIYEGEIDIGLTDTDDVWVAVANGWPIGMTFETANPNARFPSLGPTTIPNTVAMVAGGPNPGPARELAAYLVSPAVERLLAESDSRNIPVHPALRAEFADLLPASDGRPDYSDAAASVPDAMTACEDVLISP